MKERCLTNSVLLPLEISAYAVKGIKKSEVQRLRQEVLWRIVFLAELFTVNRLYFSFSV